MWLTTMSSLFISSRFSQNHFAPFFMQKASLCISKLHAKGFAMTSFAAEWISLITIVAFHSIQFRSISHFDKLVYANSTFYKWDRTAWGWVMAFPLGGVWQVITESILIFSEQIFGFLHIARTCMKSYSSLKITAFLFKKSKLTIYLIYHLETWRVQKC